MIIHSGEENEHQEFINKYYNVNIDPHNTNEYELEVQNIIHFSDLENVIYIW